MVALAAVVLVIVSCANFTLLQSHQSLQFSGSYNATYANTDSVSTCTIVNGNLHYAVHQPKQALPEFWVDIPYDGPGQTSYHGPFNGVGMKWGDYAGLVGATGTVTVTSETTQRASGTLLVRGYLYYEHPGPLEVKGAWACDIK